MKSIPYGGLLGLVLFCQSYHLLSVGQNIPPQTSPLAFYRRTLITQDRETIGSLGGAPVGLYRRRFPYQHSLSPSPKVIPEKQWKQLKEPDHMPKSSSVSFTESIGNSQNISIVKKRTRNSRRRLTRLRITKIIKDLLKAKSKKKLKSKLVSFGLGISLGTILGSNLPKELLASK